MLEGGKTDEDTPPLPPEVRTYRLLRLGVSLTEQGLAAPDGQVPARLCDWLLAIEGVENEAAAEKQRKAEREAERGR